MTSWQPAVISIVTGLALCAAAQGAATLSQDRQAFLRGEKALVKLEGSAAEGVQLDAVLRDTKQAVTFGPVTVPGTVQIDTWRLRPGTYDLSIRGQTGTLQAAELIVRGERLPRVRFGVWGDVPDSAQEGQLYDQLGVEHTQTHHAEVPDAAFVHAMDRSFKYGIHFEPGIWVHWTGMNQNKAPDDTAMILSNGSHWKDGWGVEGLCPYRPAAQQAIRERMRQLGEAIKPYPYVDAISLEDEFGMAACCCPACLARLKEKTGLTAIPKPQFIPSGTVLPEKDPCLQYLREIKWPAAGFMYTTANEAIKKVNPETAIFTIPGVFDNLDVAELEIYPGLFDDGELFIFGAGPEVGDQAPSSVRMLLSPKKRDTVPCWYLIGWYSPPMLHAPDWIFSLGTEEGKMALNNGAAAVTVTGMGKMIQKDARFRRMMEDLSHAVRSYGPMFLNTKHAPRPLALLRSKITTEYQGIVDPAKLAAASKEDKWKVVETTWKHGQSHQVAWPAAMRAHIPCEEISEDNILRGELKDFQGLLLVDFEYTSEAVKAAIETYAKEHPVLADLSTTVKIAGAQRLDFDFSRGHQLVLDGQRDCSKYQGSTNTPAAIASDRKLADEIYTRYEELAREGAKALAREIPQQFKGRVQIDNPNVVYTLAEAGPVQYLGVWNLNRTQTEKAQVNVAGAAGAVYNATLSQKIDAKVAEGKTTFTVSLPPYDGLYIVVSPQPFAAPEVQGKVSDKNAAIGLKVCGQDGAPLGAHPVDVRVVDALGRETPYGGVVGLADGKGTLSFRLADNDPAGKWHIEAKNLIDGSVGRMDLDVKK